MMNKKEPILPKQVGQGKMKGKRVFASSKAHLSPLRKSQRKQTKFEGLKQIVTCYFEKENPIQGANSALGRCRTFPMGKAQTWGPPAQTHKKRGGDRGRGS